MFYKYKIGTLRGCANGGTEQEGILFQALRATNRYNIVENTLILYGKETQLNFVLDNEAEKPPD